MEFLKSRREQNASYQHAYKNIRVNGRLKGENEITRRQHS